MRKRTSNVLFLSTWRLVLAVVIAFPSALVYPAPAEGGGFFSDVVPFVGIISAHKARNRVYNAANPYIQEKREYYDRLREKAREQLATREISSLRDSQVAAYVKLVGLIEGEREAMINFAESEKRAAREKFINTVEDIAFDRILASSFATRALGALSKGVNSSQGLVDRALDELTGGGSSALEKVQRIRRIASKVTKAGGLIGGSVGEKIQAIGGSIVQTIDRPTAEIEASLEKVQGDLADLQGEIADLQARGVQPTSSQVTRDVAIRVVTGEEAEPEVEAIVSVLAGKITGRGGTFRERARSALIGTFVARCAAIGQRYRATIARLEGEAAGETMSDEQAVAPCNAIDLDQLEQESLVEEARATAEASGDESQPEATLSPAGLVVESHSEDQMNCTTTSNFQDTDTTTRCDIAVEIHISYETPIYPATISCKVFSKDFGSEPINSPIGALTFSGVYEFHNVTMDGDLELLQAFTTCQMEANGEVLYSINTYESSR